MCEGEYTTKTNERLRNSLGTVFYVTYVRVVSHARYLIKREGIPFLVSSEDDLEGYDSKRVDIAFERVTFALILEYLWCSPPNITCGTAQHHMQIASVIVTERFAVQNKDAKILKIIGNERNSIRGDR